MASPKDIAHQQELLTRHRKRVAVLEYQMAAFGTLTPPHIQIEADEAREQIRGIKSILRGWDVAVEDKPEDGPPGSTAQPAAAPAPGPASVGAAAPANLAVEKARDPNYEYDVFISYSHKDEDWVEHTLLKRLEDAGLRVCIDFRDFVPVFPSIVNMENAVMTSKHTVIVLTEAWLNSEWSNFEALLAQTTDPSAVRGRLIPLRVEATIKELPRRISMLSWVDFAREDRQIYAWRGLFHALGVSQS
jgi:hypothetical protein